MEAEKTEALKRAYAEIILNTVKESAARIIESERKALRFQQSLFAAKEEALATLLRLKAQMDSKRKEAEAKSSSQEGRIQELEDQLNEAENIIVSLREELETVNDELNKMKNVIVQQLNEHKENGQFSADNCKCQESQLSSSSNLLPLSTSNITDSTLGQKNKNGHCCFTHNVTNTKSSKHLSTENECGSNSDLASIIMSSKELYTNGCTHRISAYEHNAITVKVPNEQTDAQVSDSMDETNVSENEKLETNTIKKENHSEGDPKTSSSSGNGQAVKCFRRLCPRKPRTTCIILKSTDCAASHNEDAISEEPPHKLLKSHSAPVSTISCNDSEDKMLGLNRISGTEISWLLPCSNRIDTVKNVAKQNNTENGEHGNIIKDSTPLSSLFTESKQNDDVKLLQIDDSKLPPADQNMKENLCVSDMKNDIAAIHSKLEVEQGNGKFLKYTFQRMRKRGPSTSKHESISTEKIAVEINSGDEQKVLLQPEKPTLVTELPRNNRRLMQVARQLISLSEKRW